MNAILQTAIEPMNKTIQVNEIKEQENSSTINWDDSSVEKDTEKTLNRHEEFP